ncbi:MAG: orotidine 5'-phosphate decarboxylase / HUMPS family protein [Sulfolobaceae archaeon]
MLKSRIILALDKYIDSDLLSKLGNELYGLKIGLPLILDLGINKVRDTISNVKVEEIIADLKLADIGYIMNSIVEKLSFANSFIAHSFIGIKGSLDELKRYLDSTGKGLYLVASMSHEGWNDSFTPYIKQVISSIEPKGVVIGATKPVLISDFRREFGNKIVIISPGVGVQGADYGSAICAGADYEIIGRSIYDSKDPLHALIKINQIIKDKVISCKGGVSR